MDYFVNTPQSNGLIRIENGKIVYASRIWRQWIGYDAWTFYDWLNDHSFTYIKIEKLR